MASALLWVREAAGLASVEEAWALAAAVEVEEEVAAALLAVALVAEAVTLAAEVALREAAWAVAAEVLVAEAALREAASAAVAASAAAAVVAVSASENSRVGEKSEAESYRRAQVEMAWARTLMGAEAPSQEMLAAWVRLWALASLLEESEIPALVASAAPRAASP